MAFAASDQGVNDNNPHRLLITGASGFVGGALVNSLQHNSRFQLVCAVRRPMQLPTGVLQQHVDDLSATTHWGPTLQGVRTVVHLAARVHVMHEQNSNPLAEFRRVNVQGTMALAKQAAAAGVQRFVYVSSIKVNGEAGVFSEADVPAPVDAYGVSKFEAENALREFAQTSGMAVVIVRPPLVYGPGVKANFRSLIKLVASGIPLPLGTVHNQRSFVSVQNLVSLIQLCVEHPRAANEIFLVSDDDDQSTTNLLREIGLALGKPARLFPVPAALLQFAATVCGQRNAAQRLLGTLRVDVTKARELLSWRPPVGFREGLRLTVQGDQSLRST